MSTAQASLARKTCPTCTQEIKQEARVCRYCGARFEIVRRGYCTGCHDVVTATAGRACPACGGALTDVRIESSPLRALGLVATRESKIGRKWQVLSFLAPVGSISSATILGVLWWYQRGQLNAAEGPEGPGGFLASRRLPSYGELLPLGRLAFAVACAAAFASLVAFVWSRRSRARYLWAAASPAIWAGLLSYVAIHMFTWRNGTIETGGYLALVALTVGLLSTVAGLIAVRPTQPPVRPWDRAKRRTLEASGSRRTTRS